MIKVVHPGIYSSIQDLGRLGQAKLGVPVSGPMDTYSAEMANVLLKNKRSDALIEITFGGAKFQFTTSTFISITGADFSAKLNDQPLEMMTAYRVEAGSILSFGKRNYGARTYLAVQGGIRSEECLESKSFLKGITNQFRLAKGDELTIKKGSVRRDRGLSRIKVPKELFQSEVLECYPGPEFDQLNQEQQDRLFELFTISEDNNRIGYRLNEIIANELPTILTSGVLPGTVQLTPSGKLIVLMRDCQVTGGYPRVLQLSDLAINKLSQKISGNTVRFEMTSSCH